MLPNNLRALDKACFFKLACAAEIEPVFFKVLEAASIAVVHFFPVLFLHPRILLCLRDLRLRLVVII